MLCAGMFFTPSWIGWAKTVFQVDAGVVVVSFTVKDTRGNYVTGLQPSQICVREDGVRQHVSSFADASGRVRNPS